MAYVGPWEGPLAGAIVCENRIYAHELIHQDLAAWENAVALIRLTMSLAIRNDFGRILK